MPCDAIGTDIMVGLMYNILFLILSCFWLNCVAVFVFMFDGKIIMNYENLLSCIHLSSRSFCYFIIFLLHYTDS